MSGSPGDAAEGRTGARRARRPMPGGAEVIRAERRAAGEGQIEAVTQIEATAENGPPPGGAIIRSAWAGTAVFAAATALAVVLPAARVAVVAVDLLLLLAGSALYLWGWGIAAGRSRDHDITLWNLILLEDAAPPKVRVRLLGALAVQVVGAAATCWITAALAFGWLVPVWGLAHCELWGARYGVFRPRRAEGARRRQR